MKHTDGCMNTIEAEDHHIGSLKRERKLMKEVTSINSIDIDGTKYRIVQQTNGELNIFRNGELWLSNPKSSKMLIAMMYEIMDSRRLLSDIEADCCVPRDRRSIKTHANKYSFDLYTLRGKIGESRGTKARELYEDIAKIFIKNGITGDDFSKLEQIYHLAKQDN